MKTAVQSNLARGRITVLSCNPSWWRMRLYVTVRRCVSPSKVPLSVGEMDPYLMHMVPSTHVSQLPNLDRLGRFRTAHPFAQNADRLTYRPRYVRRVARGRIYALVHAMRPKNYLIHHHAELLFTEWRFLL